MSDRFCDISKCDHVPGAVAWPSERAAKCGRQTANENEAVLGQGVRRPDLDREICLGRGRNTSEGRNGEGDTLYILHPCGAAEHRQGTTPQAWRAEASSWLEWMTIERPRISSSV